MAVASNFLKTLKNIAPGFEDKTGHKLSISAASSGKHYAQISNGAPYDIFLSADSIRAEKLVKNGLAIRAQIYAIGRLVFVARDTEQSECRTTLQSQKFKRLALANPKIAPYGLAAKQVLISLGLWDAVRKQRVVGENISQAYQFVFSQNASAGFLALSHVINNDAFKDYCQWVVPSRLFEPVKQKMAVLRRSENKIAVREFFDYMTSAETQKIIQQHGYSIK